MMKSKLLILGVLVLAACKSQQPSTEGCPAVMCTQEFKMIPVKLISSTGREVSFKSYKVVDIATGNEVKNNNELSPQNSEYANTLIVADDSHLRDFTEKGTALQLQVTRKDGQVIKTDFKIAGGKCACHVAKLEGPDQVDIDQ